MDSSIVMVLFGTFFFLLLLGAPISVGLGASAGGLEALRTFFGAMPAKTGLSFVVVVHLGHAQHRDPLVPARPPRP